MAVDVRTGARGAVSEEGEVVVVVPACRGGDFWRTFREMAFQRGDLATGKLASFDSLKKISMDLSLKATEKRKSL